jgi:hypothetical protein
MVARMRGCPITNLNTFSSMDSNVEFEMKN